MDKSIRMFQEAWIADHAVMPMVVSKEESVKLVMSSRGCVTGVVSRAVTVGQDRAIRESLELKNRQEGDGGTLE